MACFIPFKNRNLEICFFVFRPTVVLFDDLFDALKQFSLCTHSLGCVQCSLIQSIHGNMIIWFGTWLKKSCENEELLIAKLTQMLSLSNISTMATLIEYSFFDSYGGDSRDGTSAAKFTAGSTISMTVASLHSDSTDCHINDMSYSCLALFRSKFARLEGLSSGVCLRCRTRPAAACLYVWESLQSCYAWILSSDDHRRNSSQPFLDRFRIDRKYDVFRVVYVSPGGGDGDEVLSSTVGVFKSRHQMLERRGESSNNSTSTTGHEVLQN